MSALVQIPWQHTLWLTPQTLNRLIDAVGILGRQIYLNGQDAAWRSEARQEYLWDVNGHNPAKANSPWVGQRAHMKGGGLDVPTDKATREAMIGAGFRPDSNELWHFNDPDIAFMPIIRTNTAAASSGGTPIFDSLKPPITPPPPVIAFTTPKEHDDMSEPIYARGDLLDVWYAFYPNAGGTVPASAADAATGPDWQPEPSGPVYFARRAVSKGERAIVSALGFPHPKQKAIIVIPQAQFDAVGKVYGTS